MQEAVSGYWDRAAAALCLIGGAEKKAAKMEV